MIYRTRAPPVLHGSAWNPDEVLAISRTPGGGHRREGGAARNSRFLRRTRVVPRFLAISIHMDYQKMDYQAQGDFSSTTPAILRVPSGSQGPRFSRSTCSMPHTCPAGQANSKSGGGPLVESSGDSRSWSTARDRSTRCVFPRGALTRAPPSCTRSSSKLQRTGVAKELQLVRSQLTWRAPLTLIL